MSNVEVGQKAPDFTLSDMYGKKVSLEDYRGRIVVLVFIRHLG
ncbi:MAG: redoxin domain-containing protein [Clostridiales bacterium]|jgi:peroxiredoxin|nr:redoxin domain-containing protein [Clostridiales bacterium]